METDYLITVPTGETALAAFTSEYDTVVGPLVKRVRAEIDQFQATPRDIANPAARDEVRSFAYKIARSRTLLEDAGKAVSATLKEMPKRVDANRRLARETLEAWQDEVRAPLDAWEAGEKTRVDKHVNTIAAIKALSEANFQVSVVELKWRRDQIKEMIPADGEEYAEEYRLAQEGALGALRAALKARKAYESDQAELAALRLRERERQAEDEARRKAAEEVARARERDEIAAREAELAREAAERRRIEAELAAVKAAADKAAEDARIAAAKAEEERQVAERRAAGAKHRAKINGAVVAKLVTIINGEAEDFIDNDPRTEPIARAIVLAIARNEVPNLKIEY